MNGFMKTATETGLTILPRTMTSDHNNSQQLFEKLNTPNNSTCCWNSSSNECKKHLEVWTRLQEMHGLGKERYHWFEKGLSLVILPWPRVSSSCQSLLFMAVTKHVVYLKHIIQKRSFDSVLSSSPNSFTTEAKKQQLINNPCYSWICCCQRLWHVKGCTVEVQWKTGILQIHQFVLPSRCCHVVRVGKVALVPLCTFRGSSHLGRRFESWCPDSKLQRCSSEQHKKVEWWIYGAVLRACSIISLLQNIAPWWKKKPSITGRESHCPGRVLTKLLSFHFYCPSLLKLFS